jgi:hypothetical protein
VCRRGLTFERTGPAGAPIIDLTFESNDSAKKVIDELFSNTDNEF